MTTERVSMERMERSVPYASTTAAARITDREALRSFSSYLDEMADKSTPTDSEVGWDGRITHAKQLGRREEEPDAKRNEYFGMAQNGVIAYKGAVFTCDYERNALCLGDCSDKTKCLNIPLEKGGSVIVNRDNLDELVSAIGMFSSEDMGRIMKAIQTDKAAQSALVKLEEEKNGDPQEVAKEEMSAEISADKKREERI